MVKFKNVESLVDFMERNFKGDYYDLEAVKNEIAKQCATGATSYELSSHETKKGYTVDLGYTYTFDYNEETEETTNEIITFD